MRLWLKIIELKVKFSLPGLCSRQAGPRYTLAPPGPKIRYVSFPFVTHLLDSRYSLTFWLRTFKMEMMLSWKKPPLGVDTSHKKALLAVITISHFWALDFQTPARK